MRNLFRDTLIYGLATVSSRGLALLALPIYTRMLSPADYGALDMITVAGSLATLVVAFEITQALARFYCDAAAGSARRMMASTTLWFSIVTYSGALAIAFVGAEPIADWLLGPNMETSFRIGAAYIAVNGIFYLMQNQLRVELRSASYAALSLLYAFTTIGLGILLGYWLGFGLNGILSAQLLAALTSVFAGLWLLRGSYALAFDFSLLKEMLHFSMPLVPSGLATFLTLYANRLLLNGVMSLAAVGLFGVAARVAGIVSLAVAGLQSALTPLIYAHYQEADTPPRLARIFEGFAAVGLAFCLGLGQFAGEILTILVDSRYASAGPLVMMLAPATLLSQSYIFFPGIAITRKMHLQLFVFAVTAAVSLLANWTLISAFGLLGAVAATLLGSGVFLALWIPVSQRLYPLPIRWGAVAMSGLVYAAGAVLSFAVIQSDVSDPASFLLRLALLMLFVVFACSSGLIRIGALRNIGRLARRSTTHGETATDSPPS